MNVPNDMKYMLSRMSFNRVSTRLTPLSASSASAVPSGEIVQVRLPTNSLIDLSTLAMFFDVSLTAKASDGTAKQCGFGRGSHNLIRSIQISVGGNVVMNLNSYNRVFHALHQLTSSKDSASSKALLTYDGINNTAPATASLTGAKMSILEFYGLSGWQPSIIDTSLVGPIEISFQLENDASNAGLLSESGGAVFTAGLSNIHFYIDVIQTDDMYRQVIRESVASGVSLDIVCPNYFTHNETGTGQGYGSTFTVSSQCVDALMALCQKRGATLVGPAVAQTNAKGYFSQNAAQFIGNQVDTWQFELNGVSTPSSAVAKADNLYHQLKTWGMSSGALHGSLIEAPDRSNATTDGHTAGELDGYYGNNFIPCVRFSHGGDPRVLSGLNGKSSGGVQITYNSTDSTGSGDTQITIVALCSSVLSVNAGGTLSFLS
jgi:hypothetical protein